MADRAAHCPCRLGIQIASSHHALLDAAHTTVSTSVAAAGVSNSAGCNTGPGWSSIIRNDAAAEERGGCEELCRRVAAPAALQRASPSFHSTAASARACGGGYERSSLCAARGPLAGWLAAAGMLQRHRACATLSRRSARATRSRSDYKPAELPRRRSARRRGRRGCEPWRALADLTPRGAAGPGGGLLQRLRWRVPSPGPGRHNRCVGWPRRARDLRTAECAAPARLAQWASGRSVAV